MKATVVLLLKLLLYGFFVYIILMKINEKDEQMHIYYNYSLLIKSKPCIIDQIKSYRTSDYGLFRCSFIKSINPGIDLIKMVKASM
jgi:hypothetical protein